MDITRLRSQPTVQKVLDSWCLSALKCEESPGADEGPGARIDVVSVNEYKLQTA